MNSWMAPPAGTIALIIVTALISASIALLISKVGAAFLTSLAKPFIKLKEALYRRIAPRNPFSIALRSYKKHLQRSHLVRIENPVGPPIEVPLEHSFAPLQLLSGTTQEGIELFAYTGTHERFLVLGGPGTGKTTLMKSILLNILKGSCHPNLNPLIPVFVVLRKLAAKGFSVEKTIIATFEEYHFPGAERFVRSALDQGKMFIILDGLDEVGANREFVISQIQEFCESDGSQEHRNRVVVTCRENSYRTEDLRGVIQNVVRVEPFTNHHMRIFLQGWPIFQNRVAMRLYALIQSDPQIQDICRNPLLLTILTGLYLETENFTLPNSRERFYTANLDELLIHRPARRLIKQK